MMLFKRLLFNGCRHVVVSIVLVQRLPFFIIAGVLFLLSWLLYKIIRIHRLPVMCACFLVRIYFFINGIRIKYDGKTIRSLSDCILLYNYFGPIDWLILFSITPYKAIQFLRESFFDTKFKFFLYLLGFYPSETHFDVHSYKTTSFLADDYIQGQFVLLEGVKMLQQDTEQIPYTAMLAIKHRRPIYFFQLKGSERYKYSTFFTPKKVTVSFVEKVDVHKRLEIFLLDYKRIVDRYQGYEKTRRYSLKKPVKPAV